MEVLERLLDYLLRLKGHSALSKRRGRKRGRFILPPGQTASLQCYDTTHLLLFVSL